MGHLFAELIQGGAVDDDAFNVAFVGQKNNWKSLPVWEKHLERGTSSPAEHFKRRNNSVWKVSCCIPFSDT